MRSTLALARSAVSIALVAACATNPVTGEREFTLMSEAQEIAMGRESDAQIKAEMGVYDDPDAQQYVSDIGLQLAKLSERPNLPWQFTVVDQPAINAFALPGGFIYITRGILPFLDNEAELAGVLGHEIGHVTARHSVQQYTRAVGGTLLLGGLGVFVPAARPFGQISEQALGLLFLKYGRDDELQADGLGARYEATGGWDPAGVPGMLSTLGRLDEAAGDRKGVPNWLSTHPDPLPRVAEIQPTVQKLKAGRTDFVTDRDALRTSLDGVIFGDNPSKGSRAAARSSIRRCGSASTSRRSGRSPTARSRSSPRRLTPTCSCCCSSSPKPQGRTVQDVALASMQGAGFRTWRASARRSTGSMRTSACTKDRSKGSVTWRSRAAHIAHDGAYYLVAGLVAPEQFRAG